jgi:hypothetical protein
MRLEYAEASRRGHAGYAEAMVRWFNRMYGDSKIDFGRRLGLERAKARQHRQESMERLERLKADLERKG